MRRTLLLRTQDDVSEGLLTALPTTGLYDGRIVNYQNAAMATAGIVWTFRYDNNGGSPGTYPWHYVGGYPFRDEVVATSQTTTSASYVSFASAGPTVTVPRAGHYLVEWGFGQNQNSTSGALNFMAIKVNSVAITDTDGVLRGQAASAGADVHAPPRNRVFTLAANDVLLAQYKTNAGTFTSNNGGVGHGPWMLVTPRQVS